MNSDHNDLEKIEDVLSNKLIYRITDKENTKIIIDFSRDKQEFKNFLNVYEILLKVNISIPKIYEVNQQQYKIYMQDFGDNRFNKIYNKLFTVGGSKHSYTSLLELTKICEKVTNNKIKFSKITKTSIYDIPYYVTNNNLVKNTYNWKPKKNIEDYIKKWLEENK